MHGLHARSKGFIIVSVVVAVFATFSILAQNRTINFDGPGRHLISLPGTINSPTITNSEELFLAIGNAVRVAKHNPASDLFRVWNGYECNLCASPDLDCTSPIVGAGSCSTDCFCVDPADGLAYYADVGATGSLEMDAIDGGTTAFLGGPGVSASGTNFISLPYDWPLGNAFDLIQDLGSSNVDFVSRFICGSNSFQSYTGSSGTPFAIEPGVGYQVRLNSDVIYPAASGGNPNPITANLGPCPCGIPTDSDDDGHWDDCDNCPHVQNDQTDSDLDELGDACDNCPLVPNLDAGRLYAVDGAAGNPSSLHILDPTNGSLIQTVGPTGFDHVTGLAFDPTTGILYGISMSTNQLIRIDRTTGAGEAVGSFGSLSIPDIAFDSSGTLYGYARFESALYTLDLTDGSATLVDTCAGCTDLGATGLDFGLQDILYLKEADVVNRVNAADAQVFSSTLLDQLPSNMLAFDLDRTLFSGTRPGDGTFVLQTIDTGTGVVTDVGTNFLDLISALAFAPRIHLDSDLDGLGDDCDNCPDDDNPGQSNGDGDPAGTACDCDDGNPDIYPGNVEVCDGLDNDCSGIPDDGLQGDVELCDLIDQNCNGDLYDFANDQPCSTGLPSPCDAGTLFCTDPATGTEVCQPLQPPVTEDCTNGIDDDCDGLVDLEDLDNSDHDTIPNCLDNCPLTDNEDQLDSDFDGIGDACDVELCGAPLPEVAGVRWFNKSILTWNPVPPPPFCTPRHNVWRGYFTVGNPKVYNHQCIYDNVIPNSVIIPPAGGQCGGGEPPEPRPNSYFYYLVTSVHNVGVNVNQGPFGHGRTSGGNVCPDQCRDIDGDLVDDGVDLCPPDGTFDCITFNPRPQADSDGDGHGDICDNCDQFNPDQANNDLVEENVCPENFGQEGDVCDLDDDNDGVLDDVDNCVFIKNGPAEDNQADCDLDLIGDACDFDCLCCPPKAP